MKFVCLFLGMFLSLLIITGCEYEVPMEIGTDADALINSTDVEDLIADGRSRIGTYGGQCKDYVRVVVDDSYDKTIEATDSSQYKWVNDTASTATVTNMARWLGSYVNGRYGSYNQTLGAGATATQTISVPNNDPQKIILYANSANVTATLTKSSSSIAVTSTGGVGGTVSGSTISGSGSWTLTIKNDGTSAVGRVVAVVLSWSRFTSDWETARRGDIIQMYGGTGSANRNTPHPHTTLIQTNYNSNGNSSTCGTSSTTGCNWLDSNWSPDLDGIVRAHNISINDMAKMISYRSDYGFTVYRLK